MKSEIRESTIRNLLDKVAKRSYRKYLPKMTLKHLRAFRDQPVSFDFPVTAIIGPNGGGKTSVLGAAAIAYSDMAPRQFFAKGGKYDSSMQDWAIEYELIDREINQRDVVRRTASFKRSKWNRDSLKRSVRLFGIRRTVPANERREFLKLASSKFSVPDTQIEGLTEQSILASYKQLKIDRNRDEVFLTGKTPKGDEYSEFHFGAGESSIIRMVSIIELAPDESLILIEELENGLHPVATIRMTEYLIEVCERKKMQVIFTTHSDDALGVLPTQAIWVAVDDRILQGKMDIKSLRAITGKTDPDSKLVVFVEDRFAKIWTEAMLRQSEKVALDHVEIHPMQGDGIAVSVNAHHRQDPSVKVSAICLIDGDSLQKEEPQQSVYRLPGAAPECEVFDEVLQGWPEIGGKLAVALLQRFEDAAKVKEICDGVRLTNMDTHLLFAQIGEKLGLLPEETVAQAFANLYAQHKSDRVKTFLLQFHDLLPDEN
jgi:energy-coupling factor transporter ATP-binding protein EcfA2